MKNEGIIISYIPHLIKWEHADSEKFNGVNFENFYYEFRIIGRNENNSEYSFFKVFPIKTITNNLNGKVFECKTLSAFKLKNDLEPHLIKYLFQCVEIATEHFVRIFYEKGKSTNVYYRRVPKPNFNMLKDILLENIRKAYK